MSGYASQLSDIAYLFDVASEADRAKVLRMLHASARMEGDHLTFFDEGGAKLTLADIHQRTQRDPVIQRSVYNMWMTYAH
jgi:hypothetical protein